MPILQIDGVNIADISRELADILSQAAKVGLGNETKPAGFQRVVQSQMSAPRPPTRKISVELEFPIKQAE
jgi:hypothetical protein